MPRIHCLFIHVPKFRSYYQPFGEFMCINYMPMGLLAMADLLSRAGHPSHVLHLGVEWIENKSFSIVDKIDADPPLIAAFDLHWHYQSYDVIEVLSKIKHHNPETFTVIGGFTASIFAEEIMATFPEVDAIVCGHGEIPMLSLLSEIVAGGLKVGLENVENLFWRDGDKIIKNQQVYFPDQEMLDSLCYTNLELLENYPTYVKSFGFPLLWSKALGKEENRRLNSMGVTMFPLFVGRGCPVNCTWCGGGAKAQHITHLDSKVVFRSPERVAESVVDVKRYGYETVHICFDPSPHKPDYYLELFSEIRKRGVDIGLYFECWALPEPEFIEAVSRTFRPEHTTIALSPESGSERVRRFNKGFFYTNDELYRAMSIMEKSNVRADLFFTLGVPSETVEETTLTEEMIATLRNRYSNIQRLMTWTIQIEPASPLFLEPERFGVCSERRAFKDFYLAHGGDSSDTYSSLGYSIPDYFKDSNPCRNAREFEGQIQALKCRQFCFFNADPSSSSTTEEGRLQCAMRELLWRVLRQDRIHLGERRTFD